MQLAAFRDHAPGTSLVEALVATVIFAVGVTALVPLVLGSVRAVRAARDTGLATWLAWQKLEELRGLADADLGSSPAASLEADAPGYVDHLDQNGNPTTAPGVYVRRWTIGPAGSGPGLTRLAVAVHHVGAPGVPVTVATLRAGGTP
jgi:type II secretory pathway pseudopilin PulG